MVLNKIMKISKNSSLLHKISSIFYITIYFKYKLKNTINRILNIEYILYNLPPQTPDCITNTLEMAAVKGTVKANFIIQYIL